MIPQASLGFSAHAWATIASAIARGRWTGVSASFGIQASFISRYASQSYDWVTTS
jgi:hypothetical protein